MIQHKITSSKDFFEVTTRPLNRQDIVEVLHWCRKCKSTVILNAAMDRINHFLDDDDNIFLDSYARGNYTYTIHFQLKDDALAFKLRWS